MSTLAVNTITDVAGSLPPVFPAGSPQLNPLANREDKIINGDFGVWQRGTSSTTAGYVAADRWPNSFLGGTVTQSRQAFALGDILGSNNPSFHLRQTVSGQTLSTQYSLTEQRIESVRSYAGQTITVLGWARRSSGTGNMVVEGVQWFGAGGSPSAQVVGLNPTTITLTGSWAPFAAVITVPSVTGKTLGTDGKDFMGVLFWASAGSTFNARTNSLGLQTIGVDLWGIHIRQGTWTAAATADYRPRDPDAELSLCYRYYQIVPIPRLTGVTYTPNGDTRARFSLIQAVRAAPTFTVSGTTSVIANGSAGDVINIGLGTLTIGGAGTTGGTVVGITNFAAFSACGPVMSWGDNGGGALTILVDAEI